MSTQKSVAELIEASKPSAPRITPEDIKAAIKSVHYFTAGDGYSGALVVSEAFNALPIEQRVVAPPASLDLLTFCVVELHNGFTVTGESACASPENFDAEIGQRVAYEMAERKIWPLLGYQLKCELAKRLG